ncbi:hypothetical protein KEM60_02155 [Austwickia sp. TVS 96-490-7B]|uniref:hypothetical protein n=1 Tax=Austwickia sp. TVS 96-490-7B TaxID=2830843 RepID=UPI001C566D5E|nr:hypothetical protein [Austwickia sp. TVS 96-490-7B]MBW3085944.1 hypothetical protein [Austwickia sp. TVS 96-490-7B]
MTEHLAPSLSAVVAPAAPPSRVVLLPGTPLLLRRNASLHDPVAELRAACHAALAWVGPHPQVIANPAGGEMVEDLLAAAAGDPREGEGCRGGSGILTGTTYVVVGNGTACRTPKAPGMYDERAAAFDALIRRALVNADVTTLTRLDPALLNDLKVDAAALPALIRLLDTPGHDHPPLRGEVTYDDAPYGVQYWVMRWERTIRG